MWTASQVSLPAGLSSLELLGRSSSSSPSPPRSSTLGLLQLRLSKESQSLDRPPQTSTLAQEASRTPAWVRGRAGLHLRGVGLGGAGVRIPLLVNHSPPRLERSRLRALPISSDVHSAHIGYSHAGRPWLTHPGARTSGKAGGEVSHTIIRGFAEKLKQTSAGEHVGDGTLVHRRWDCKLGQPLWKTVWSFPPKLHIEQQSECTPKGHEIGAPKRCLCPTSVAASHTTAKMWKPPTFSSTVIDDKILVYV